MGSVHCVELAQLAQFEEHPVNQSTIDDARGLTQFNQVGKFA